MPEVGETVDRHEIDWGPQQHPSIKVLIMLNRTVLVATASMFLGCVLVAVISSPSTARAESTRSAVMAAAEAVGAASIGHCEIPCGIYDDNMMVREMLLDAETIRKASAQIVALAEKVDAASLNTISRWVLVKEEHSRELQHMNAWYFMTQRVKAVPEGEPGHDEYLKRLSAHHLISVSAMKATQSLDPAVQVGLTAAIKVVEPWYPAREAGADATDVDENWTRLAERAKP
jgi:nickel superoxide dismutase